ncbi:putative ABC transport system permease protein [Alkalibaculum bacchi]|uniref:Putative ABC transport system permease protein n=1 Tax=Alkalibaculum bacchi TaxID=645887 RepID=A0A366IBG5_9FIRM|nr:ABC transporter permease [Alkalibaculum bacchi]RBP66009.1 putative ABC transport system permease protein [Alkalibaculum bacchi]
MKSAMWKDFFREIKKSCSRFISIFAIVFIGVAFFAGIKATAPDMKNSMDVYYDDYNLMDLQIMSTLGITDEDIKAIGKVKGVDKVQPGYFTDVVSKIGSTEIVIKVHSIPSVRTKDSLNQIKLTEGRLPEKSGECILEDNMFMDLGLEVGDIINIQSGKAEAITEETLAVDRYKIVGKAITPYYLSYEKGSSEIGNGKVDTYMMVLENDFILPVYTEAIVSVKGAKELNSYGKEYKETVSNVSAPLENLGTDRSLLRLDEVKSLALEELEKAKTEFEEQKKVFEEEMKKAEDKLNKAQMDLVEGETKLETEKKNFQVNYQNGLKQIEDAKKRLANGEKQYAEGLATYNQAMSEHGEDLKNLDNMTSTVNGQRQEASQRLEEINAQLNNPDLTEEERSDYSSLKGYYENFLGLADTGVSAINELNDFSQGQVRDAERQLKSAETELARSKNELNRATTALESSKRKANSEFRAAEARLAKGWKDYENGKAEYEKEKVEGQEKIDEGKEKIIRAENEIEKISKPQWYVLDRDSLYSFTDYKMTAERIDAIAKIFPLFFFLIAGLVCMTTMTRMVDEQRMIIGAYKALGYNNKSIALKYVLYAALASILGGVAGLSLGLKVFPEVIYNAWTMMYTLPPMVRVTQIPLMFISVLIGVLVTTLSAFGACYKELKETPALLMRPKAPKAGKKIFLEKINFIWNRLSFSHKVTARNIFRYKKRFFMTIIGISGCCALLLAGFGLSDSIGQIVNNQYKEIFKYDLDIKYDALIDRTGHNEIKEILSQDNNIKMFTEISQYNAKLKSDNNEISATLIIPSNKQEFDDFITLRDRRSQEAITLPKSGVIISEKLSKELHAKVGDMVEMDDGYGSRKKVVIHDITENYVFHYVYMSPEYYREIFRLSPQYNSLMVKLKETSPKIEEQLGSKLAKHKGVASVLFYSGAISNFEDMVNILNNIVVVIIISAGLLAFVVLYNLTNINIRERIREIATIKVLGFYNREVSAYVFRENVILSLIASIVGLGVGIILHSFIMVSLEQNGIMYGNYINPISFLYAFFITLLFVFLVNVFMYRSVTNIPMVESLKSIE